MAFATRRSGGASIRSRYFSTSEASDDGRWSTRVIAYVDTALHLATALAVRDQVEDLVLASRDESLGRAARSMGLPVEGRAVAR